MPDLDRELVAWQTARRSTLAPGTFNLELATIKAILEYAVVTGQLARNPAADLQPNKAHRPEKPVPTAEQFTALLSWLREHGHARSADFAEFLACSGCREDESRRLQWRDVDFTSDKLLVGRGGHTKNGRENLLPLFPKLKALLLRVRAERPDEPSDGLIWDNHNLRYHLPAACDALNLPHYHHHTFRHFFAVQSLKALGMDRVGIVARWLNHSDGGKLLLSLYGNHVTEDESRLCAEKL
jgi:integrase